MSSWSRGRTVTRQAFGVVRENPYMLAYPIVAAVSALVLFFAVAAIGAAIIGVGAATDHLTVADRKDGITGQTYAISIITLFVAGYFATAATQLCMGGLVKSADEELQGRDSSFGQGMSAAFGKLGPLLGWALIQTAVGWLLHAVRGNGSGGNAVFAILRLVLASLLAVAWSLITFFVLPLIMLRNEGPISAIKQSFSLLKRSWGTQVAGGLRIGGIIFLIGILPGILLLIVGVFGWVAVDSAVFGVPFISVGVVLLILASILIGTLRAVFSVALLHYAEDGSAIGPFDTEELRSAVKVKGSRA